MVFRRCSVVASVGNIAMKSSHSHFSIGSRLPSHKQSKSGCLQLLSRITVMRTKLHAYTTNGWIQTRWSDCLLNWMGVLCEACGAGSTSVRLPGLKRLIYMHSGCRYSRWWTKSVRYAWPVQKGCSVYEHGLIHIESSSVSFRQNETNMLLQRWWHYVALPLQQIIWHPLTFLRY